MDPFEELRDLQLPKGNLDLTIGNFDGVHLGHQEILKTLRSHRIVLTFSNHPQAVLTGQTPPLLVLPHHRLKLLHDFKAQTVCQLPFTHELSRLEPRAFLTSLRSIIPFSRLVLGHDAAMGYQKQGTAQHLLNLASEMGFALTYLPAVKLDGEIVSSSVIRSALAAGHLDKVRHFLARPYSIRGCVCPGAGLGRTLGYPTANIDISSLALPPFGVYAVWVELENKKFKALANLGRAPTLHQRPPALEVHLLDYQADLYGQEIEVTFLDFVRPEKRFNSPHALKEQIHQDLQKGRDLFVSHQLELASCTA